MSTKYFFGEDDEMCYLLKHFKNELLASDENEFTLIEAEIEHGTDHFYCSEYQEVGLKSEGGCGVDCEMYAPRNGTNGRCKHSNNCYTPTDKQLTLVKVNGKVKIKTTQP